MRSRSEPMTRWETMQALAAAAFLILVVYFACTVKTNAGQEKKVQWNCAVNCMDGRCQDPVKKWMQENCDTAWLDTVTEPGPNKILAENKDKNVIENTRKRIKISVDHHGAKTVAIVGHDKCAGNPATKEEQVAHLKAAKKTVESFNLDVRIILLWVDGDFKTVHKIE